MLLFPTSCVYHCSIEFQAADGASSAVEEHLSSTRRFWLLKDALIACGYLPADTKVDNSRYAVRVAAAAGAGAGANAHPVHTTT